MKYHLGIDIGSASVKTVLLDDENTVVFEDYTRIKDQPARIVLAVLEELVARFDPAAVRGLAATGAGGRTAASLLGGLFVNEIVAQAKAAGHLHPEARTIIDIGGEDSKLICLDFDPALKTSVIRDFAMNTICAAGTGSFLDQQANRLGVAIEDEFGELALRSENPPRIAGRCSVFAKTDMIHLQQEGTPDYDIIAGLCFALARTFKSGIAKGKDFQPPVFFQGGVAANRGIVRAFREVLGLEGDDFVVPERHALMGAIGAAFHAREKAAPFAGLDLSGIKRYLAAPPQRPGGLPPLGGPEPGAVKNAAAPPDEARPAAGMESGRRTTAGFLGIDVGSISTNVVVIDRAGTLLARRYLPTAGRPIEAVRRGIGEIGAELAGSVDIIGVGTTGSGRYLIGDFVGADTVKNEITAQATAAAHIDPKVDTIFEIGGQDSKYISLDNGVIVDFEMNKVCAAGTGSFLEEQAERLGVSIRDEFADLAFRAQNPVPLGERCTVFMETELTHHQQAMAPREELAAGLAYSIVQNYLNRVVARRRVGDNIFFQGAVALNRSVVTAFEKSLGKKITVPPDNDVTGAIGAALLAAREAGNPGRSRFKGWDEVVNTSYRQTSFECADCANHCEIRKVTVGEGNPFHYGSRCEKYNVGRKAKPAARVPDLFAEREKLLFRTWVEPPGKTGERIGLPRALIFHELFPFWKAFLEALGFEIVLSDRTSKAIIRQGIDTVAAETCFPVKVAHGHIANLLEKDVDFIFLPMVVNMRQDNPALEQSYNCPYVQTLPFMARSAFDFSKTRARLLTPVIAFGWGEKVFRRNLRELAPLLGRSRSGVAAAAGKGRRAQELFIRSLQERGREIMADLPADRVPVVIVSRPYNGCDPGVNLNLPRKLTELGALPLPMDFLPLDSVNVAGEWPDMYWRYGQKILAAAEIIRGNDRLECLYITNFGCGPDSFVGHFFKEKMREKPYLEIEVDEHSADVGAITRCEAFLDSVGRRRPGPAPEAPGAPPPRAATTAGFRPDGEKTIYIPDMGDAAHAMRAALAAEGIRAAVFPKSNEETLALGRRFTCGKECYPCIITTGDMLRVTRAPDFDPGRTVFFMPSAMGPCRFGQYNKLQRLILDENGLQEVPIISPNQINNLDGELRVFGRRVFRNAWRGVVAIDTLGRLARETRPYEKNPGETDRAYLECRDMVTAALERKKPLLPVMRAAGGRFRSVPVESPGEKPVISIVGEIFVRLNEFSNNNIVRQVEALGGEVRLAPTSEWFLHVNRSLGLYQSIRGRYGAFLLTRAAGWLQHLDERRITGPVLDQLRDPHEPTVAQCWRETEPYLPGWYGEAALSVGKSADSWRRGAAGIINVMPFTCLPGNIAAAVFKRFREDHDNIPCLNMAYDGLEQVNAQLQLEAFVHQARQYRAARERRRKG